MKDILIMNGGVEQFHFNIETVLACLHLNVGIVRNYPLIFHDLRHAFDERPYRPLRIKEAQDFMKNKIAQVCYCHDTAN